MIDTLKLIRAVINTDLKQSEKITLIACIYKVDWKSWRADYPISVKSLSVESGLGLRTVTRALQVLEEKNYIKRVGTHRAGGQWASTLELLPSTILPPAKLTPPPCQIDTTPCQIDGRIYPINSTPIKSSNGNLDPVLKTNSAVNSMADYLKRRELENQEWNIRKKGILR